MTDNQSASAPDIPAVPVSWLRPHAAHIAAVLEAQHQEKGATSVSLAVALVEEAGLFSTALTRWLVNPRSNLGGEVDIADIQLALAGVVVTAYALAHQMNADLDDWAAIKLRQLYADAAGKAEQ
jgi:hypothetical protein